jgi:hypothetical protein
MESRCPSCGTLVDGGSKSCQGLFEELGARTYRNIAYGRFHRMAVDAYSLQHPDAYCASAKSLMAHLGGLCCAFDYGNAPAVHSALLRSLNGAVALEKPELPSTRGALTIAHALFAPNFESYGVRVEEWARAAWDAYAELQPYARAWLEKAIR